MDKRRTQFNRKWVSVFAPDVSQKDIQDYVLAPSCYIWHVFSYEMLPAGSYLEGDEARRAFDNENKEKARYLEYFEEGGLHRLAPGTTAASLDELAEVYVVGPGFEWTYIKTHEDDWCGPYFMKRLAKDNDREAQ